MTHLAASGAFFAGAVAVLATLRRRAGLGVRSLHSVNDVRPCNPPLVLTGKVINGFGRGGKLLNCPTANMEIDPSKVDELEAGIYFGWAKLHGEEQVYKMVTSIGWNPTFNNTNKTVEPHLLHSFKEDFYGKVLTIVICGYMRPELKFDSFDALIEAIETDKTVGNQALDSGAYDGLKALM